MPQSNKKKMKFPEGRLLVEQISRAERRWNKVTYDTMLVKQLNGKWPAH